MFLKEKIKSKEDVSVNFLFSNNVEARYVRREREYFIVYISSHNGCNKACRFCHLTQTKQTDFDHQGIDSYVMQVSEVLKHYDSVLETEGKADRVNINFMARGEPLANKFLLENAKEIFEKIDEMAKERGLKCCFNISTIMPDNLKDVDLVEVFKDIEQEFVLYYSLYSVNSSFRKRWLPYALDPREALKKIEDLQQAAGNKVAFHWAFIEGENDKDEDVNDLKQLVAQYNIKAKFNLVRYNPYSENQGKESSDEVLNKVFLAYKEFFQDPTSRIVPRVGYDVKASCGMFLETAKKITAEAN